MVRIPGRAVLLIVAAGALAVAPSVAGARQIRHDPKHGFGHGTSGNWSGYAVDGTGATSVTGSWIQPASVNCASVPNSWSSPWVGIDGDNSATVEQTGTDSDCVGGVPSYYAWWEMYPKGTVVIPASLITVKPFDAFTATVSYGSAGFTLTLRNTTTGQSFSTTQTSKKAKRSSVEWIMEGPASGNLTGFSPLSFTGASAMFGTTPVSPNSPSADAITMVTKHGVVRAAPALSQTTENAFGVTWSHS